MLFSKASFHTILATVPFLYSTAFAQTTACNNSPSLCSKPYNNITHLGAHDSPFLRDASTAFSTSGNQYYNSTVQLDAGVRLLSAQVHKKTDTTGDDAWHLCHSRCDLMDAGPLSSWLSEIKTWMEAHPNEVVTVLIVNSDDATSAEIGQQFVLSGIDELAYVPPSPTLILETWPTLENLIANGTRLVTFVTNIGTEFSPAYPYLMDEFSFIFENDFENEEPEAFDCVPTRPTGLTSASAASSGRMFLMNHFLYSVQLFGLQTPNATYVNVTNAETGLGSLGLHIGDCKSVYSKPPTFVLVDFFNVGPAIASVDQSNGVVNPVGRKAVSEEPLDETRSAASAVRASSFLAVAVGLVVAVGFGI